MPAAISDLVAGGITGSKELINPIRMMRNTIGTITDPNTAWMLLRSLETLELRMTRAGENAAKVCAFLRDHPKVESVGYLGFLEEGGDARQADIYRRHCTGAGSTFSLYLKGGEREAFAFLDALKIAHLAVSLGGTETLASAPGGDDPSVGPRRAQAGARHHRQSRPRLDRRRGCRRSDRRFRPGAGRGLRSVIPAKAGDLEGMVGGSWETGVTSACSMVPRRVAERITVPPVEHFPAFRLREADQAGVGVGGEGLVGPVVDRRVGDVVGIEADVDRLALQALALQPGLDHVELGEAVAIAAVDPWRRSGPCASSRVSVAMTSSKPSRRAIAAA